MRIVQSTSSLFNSISVPEIFVSQVLPGLSGDSVRLYMYLLYLCSRGQTFAAHNLLTELRIDRDTMDACLLELEKNDLLVRSGDAITVCCLPEIKLRSMYRPLESTSPSQVPESGGRAEAIDTINRLFFNGLMSSVWYSSIDKLFNQYDFDPEVMVMLFHQCKKYDCLNINYATRIAENWHSEHIRTMTDLNMYEERFSGCRAVRDKIVSALNLGRHLTVFEEELVSKWVNTYGYGYDIIELALASSVNSSRLSFKLFDRILTEWHDAGLTSPDQVKEYIASRRGAPKGSGMRVKTPNGNADSSSGADGDAQSEEIRRLLRRNNRQ